MYCSSKSALKRIIIIFLIITLTYYNLVLIGSNLVKGLFSYALDDEEPLPEVVMDQELVTNTVCQVNNEQKKVVQVKVTSGIEAKEHPIKETTMVLKTNILDGYTLEDVKVTKLNQNSFTSGSYLLNENQVTITLLNENEELDEKEQGLDELLVTYVFENKEEETETEVIEEITETIIKPVKTITVETFANKEVGNVYPDANFEETEVEGNVFGVEVLNNDIHKTEIKDTQKEYTEKLNIDLSYRKDLNSITVKDESNTFYNKEETETDIAHVQYLKTKINKEDLLSLLGDNGKLKILEEEKILAELTTAFINNQELDEKVEQKIELENEEIAVAYITVGENFVEIEYAVDVSGLLFELTNIKNQSEEDIELSNLSIENTRAILFNIQDTENKETISENLNYFKELEDLDYLKQNVNYVFTFINHVEENEALKVEKNIENIIKFKDTVTRVSLAVDPEEWRIGEENTVNYSITLDTGKEKSELFKNPVFVFELPSCVERVNEENSQFTVENDNGVFTKEEVGIYTLPNGTKLAVMKFTGEQTAETIAQGNTVINLTLSLTIKNDEDENAIAKTRLLTLNDLVTVYENGNILEANATLVKPEAIVEEQNEQDPQTPKEPTEGEDEEDELIPADTFSAKVYFNEYNNEEEEHIVKVGEEFEYVVALYNSETEPVNIRVEDVMPDGIEFIEVNLYNYNDDSCDYTDKVNIEQNVAYNPQTRKLTVAINDFEPAQLETIGTTVIEVEDEETGELVEETVELKFPKQTAKLLKIKVKAISESLKAHNVENEINVFKNNVEHSVLNLPVYIDNNTVEFSVKEIPASIKLNDYVEFEIAIKNNGKTISDPVNVKVDLPEELKFIKVEEDDYSLSLNLNKYSDTMVLNGEETRTLVLTAQYIQDPGEEKNVEISIKVNGEERVLNISLLTEVIPIDDPTNIHIEYPDVTPENPTGDPTEPTDNPGDGQEGETDGQNTEGNNSSENETDKPQVDKKEFDLSLKQNIQKIVVTNSNGTETYNYNKDTSVGKIEIHSKQMNGSTVSIEYIITVKNNGTENGYARKIVDYLPKGMTFTSELNPDWYVGDDGNIYSVKFIDKVLKPGEEVELKLVLLKQMTDQNTGTVENIAEIYEATNDEGLEDINSIPGNKLPKENDMSSTQVIIAVKTGRIVIYLALALTILAILVYGIYNTRKVTLKSKGDK